MDFGLIAAAFETSCEEYVLKPLPRLKLTFDKAYYTQYSAEIFQYMLVQERYRARNRGTSPQLQYRNHMVDLLQKVVLRRELHRNTLHLAVYLMDIYMDNHVIATGMMNMVAIVSLVIAAKMDECESAVPRYSGISKFITLTYTVAEYVEYELAMLRFFEWNLNVPTVAVFVDFYIEHIITPEDFERYRRNPVFEHCVTAFNDLKTSVADVAFEIVDLCLLDIVMLDELPSQLAAAAIAAARDFFNLEYWNETLETLTGFTLFDIHNLTSYVVAIKNKGNFSERPCIKKQKITPDSGYMTHKSDTESEDEERSAGPPLPKKPRIELRQSQSI